MPDATVDVSMLPRTMRERDRWGVTEQLAVDFTDAVSNPFRPTQRPGTGRSVERYSLEKAISKIEHAEADLHLQYEFTSDHVILEWQTSPPDLPVDNWEVKDTIADLQSYTEYINDGNRAQTIVKAPIDSGAHRSKRLTMYSGSFVRPIWSPTTDKSPVRSSKQTVAELSEQVLYEHIEPYLAWTHPDPEPSQPDPSPWLLTADHVDATFSKPALDSKLSDDEILELANTDPETGKIFQELMETPPEDLAWKPVMSQQALMNLLAYWFCFDTEKMKHHFGTSALAGHTTVNPDGSTNIERLVARALQFVDDCFWSDHPENDASLPLETWDPRWMQIVY